MRKQRSGLVCVLAALAALVLACRGSGEGGSQAASADKAKQKPEAGKIAAEGQALERVASAAETGSSESPAIRFDETEFDFGEAEAGKDVEHLFSFRNVGGRTLTIEKVGST